MRITIGGHTYRTTVASRGGRFPVPLSADNRVAAGVAPGEQVEVERQADTAPREVTLPADLADALAQDSTAQDFFDALFLHAPQGVDALDRGGEEARNPPGARRRRSRRVARG